MIHPIFLGFVGVIFLLFLVIVQICIYRPRKNYLNLLLSISIFGIIWYVFTYVITYSKYILYYPFLFNKGMPMYYLIAPCMYLYIRGSLNPKDAAYRPSHFFHFIPAIPGLIDILPFTLSPPSIQSAIVKKVVEDISYAFIDNYYIVSPIHWLVFPMMACMYGVAQFRFIRSAARKKQHSRRLILWLYLLTLMMTAIFIMTIIICLVMYDNLKGVAHFLVHSRWTVVMCFFMLMLSILFFFNHEFVYELKRKTRAEAGDEPVAADPLPENAALTTHSPNPPDEDPEGKPLADLIPLKDAIDSKTKVFDPQLIKKVEHLIRKEEVFRRSGLTLSEFASISEIPNHKLTHLFNTHYAMGFKEYVNLQRVAYAKKRLDQGDYKRLTLEAIAIDAGFLTRNTFFVAFKKHLGMKPSEYVSRISKVC